MKRFVLFAFALASSAALADDYLGFKMVSDSRQPFVTWVDSRSQQPAGLNYLAMQAAAERAWTTWNGVQCSFAKVQMNHQSVGTVPNPVSTTDDFSVGPVWMLTNDADAREIFGVGPTALVASISLPRAFAGVLQTCDTYFNGYGVQWSVDTITPVDRMDVETVMLHEAGHCLGLDHYTPYDAVMDAWVQSGEAVRALTTTDVTKFCDRYPAAGESGSPCLADGGCSTNLKCLSQPVTNGVALNLCTRGCGVNTGANCDLPLTCQNSAAFAGFNGACLMPGSIVTLVGRTCTMATECGNSFAVCILPAPASNNNQFWVGGYCSQSCEAGDPVCPAGSECVSLDIGKKCAQSCRVGLADCRPEYACAATDALGTSGVCLPRCYSDADCVNSNINTCRICDGVCVPKQNVSGQIGDGCTSDTDCGAGQNCRITDATSTVKQCTQQCARGCGLCPSGSTCTPGARGELFCLRDCTGPGTCPAGLRCATTPVGQSCSPACTSDTNCPVGESCQFGECVPPAVDSGCGTLCTRPDAGKPIVVVPKDAGSGGGGTGGCGCTSVDPMSVFAAFAALGLLRRRQSCRAR